jgi:hypothetical protein
MKHALAITFATLMLSFNTPAGADATLKYELTEADGSKVVKQFSIARFFVRIDDPADKDHFLLYQAGKFFPLFSVDQANSHYTRLTPAVTPYMSSNSREHHGADQTTDKGETRQASENRSSPAPKLKPTKKTRKVAGIECRVVHELLDGKPVIEHCMANSARLNIADREVITMARALEMARNRNFGWLGIGTEDEEFVSLQSKDLRDNRVLQLTAVSTKPLDAGYLRIPRSFTEIKPEAVETAETGTSKKTD